MKTKLIYLALLISSFLKAQYLEQYIKEAFNNNRNLELLSLNFKIDEAAIKDAKNLTDTQIGLGYFFESVETRVGSQLLKVSAKQSIPWFGTLKSRKATAQAKANISGNKEGILKNEIRLMVTLSYLKIQEQYEQIKIFKKQLKLLISYKKIATAQLSYASKSPVNIIKIKIEINKIKSLIDQTYLSLHSAEKSFNLLLNRDLESSIKMPSKLSINKALNDSINREHPKLKIFQFQEEWLSKSIAQNKKEAKPKLNFGIYYILTQKRNNINIIHNGKDAILPSIGLKIPLFSNKYKTKNTVLHLKKEALYTQKEQLIIDLKIAYEQHLSLQKQALIEYNSQNDNLKQTEQIQKYTLASYQNTRSNFEALIDIQQDALKYELKKLKALINYNLEQAFLENLSL